MNKLLSLLEKKKHKLFKACGIRGNGLQSYDGVDLIGLNFAPKAAKSGRLIDIATAQYIVQSVPDHVIKVGVFLNNTLAEMIDCAQQIPLDALQVHDNITHGDVQNIKETCGDIGIIKVLSKEHIMEYPLFLSFVDCFIFDNSDPGSGLIYDYNLLNKIPTHIPFLIAGGINTSNVAQVLHDVPNALGVDSASGIEEILPDGTKTISEKVIHSFANAIHLASIHYHG